MKTLITLLISSVMLVAQAPPTAQTPKATVPPTRTELTVEEKSELHDKVADMIDLQNQISRLNAQLKAMDSSFSTLLDSKRDIHNAKGCSVDFQRMRWNICTPPK